MTIELINTGTELMLGRVLNTHQQWICRQLADRGYRVDRQVAVEDSAVAIESAVREGLSRADLVITTGGLGPTCDDLTRDRIAGLLGKPLVRDDQVQRHIEGFFAGRRRPVPPNAGVQSMVPAGARVLWNAHGTAPGLAIRVDPNPFRRAAAGGVEGGGAGSWLVLLPGPPRELRPMFLEVVVPFLAEVLPLQEQFVCRTLRTTGIGESWLEDRLQGPLQPFVDRGMELGFCARVGEVDVRLAARGPGADQLVAAAEQAVRAEVGREIYGPEGQELEEAVVRLLKEHGLTLAVAESCTGGFVGNRLTHVSGASEVFLGGWITYSNQMKQSCLGVDADILQREGAVSAAVARQMAEGARRASGADYALALTGIAGPTGGSEEKPVGTVYIGLAGPGETRVIHSINAFDRSTFKWVSSQQALDLVRRVVLGQ